MKNLLNTIKSEIQIMNQDISFVKTMSIYGYVVIGASAMLVGLLIGVNS